MPPPPQIPTAEGVHWPTYAEVHAALSRLLDNTEARIVARIDERNTVVHELEKRVRAAELSLLRVQTIGAVLWLFSTLLSPLAVGWILHRLP